MAPKIGTGEDYSCWDDGMARRKVGEEKTKLESRSVPKMPLIVWK